MNGLRSHFWKSVSVLLLSLLKHCFCWDYKSSSFLNFQSYWDIRIFRRTSILSSELGLNYLIRVASISWESHVLRSRTYTQNKGAHHHKVRHPRCVYKKLDLSLYTCLTQLYVAYSCVRQVYKLHSSALHVMRLLMERLESSSFFLCTNTNC